MHPLQHLLSSDANAPRSKGFIGVDLDGTLAHYKEGDCHNCVVGKPIEPMMQRVRRWLKQGKEIKIFTARARDPQQVAVIKQWLREQNLPDLEITNIKEPAMIEFYDDRAVAVKKNTGEIV